MKRHLLAVHSGVVECQVQPAELGHGAFDQRLGVTRLAHVGLLEHCPSAGLLNLPDDFVARGSIAVADDDSGSRLRHCQRTGTADPRAAPGNNTDAAG
jgi:hypothetical protein